MHRPEQVLALLLVLLLLAAVLAGNRLRDDARVARLLAASAVQAELTTGRVALTPGRGGAVMGTAIGSVRLTATAGPALSVVGVRADAGWQTSPVPGSVLRPGGELLVGLEQAVTCGRPPHPPTRLTLTVAVRGASQRTVDVPVQGTATGVQEQSAVLCGDLDAADALILTASSSLSRGDGTLLELELANRGTSAVTVLGAVYAGFSVTFVEDLPAALPGRAPGPSDDTGLPARVLHARVRVVACGPARVVLDRAAQRRPPDLLSLQVDGRGGRGVAEVDVRGLLAYLEGDWQKACG